MKELTLHITNDVEELEKFSPFVEEMEERLGISKNLIFKVHLALDEMLTNAVSYAYPGETGRPISLSAKNENGKVICEIQDEGKPFNPLENAPEVDTSLSAEERPIGGLGIFLTQNMTDKMEYERKDDHNILRLTFNIQ